MGIPVIVGLVVAIVISIAATTFAILSARRATPDQETDLSPGSIDDLQGTKTNEGLVIPLIYGRVRIPGNVIWYGNLIYETLWAFGGAGGAQQTGFRYFLDIWQGVCLGKANLIAIYVDNQKVEDLGVQEPIWTYLLAQWNNGYSGTQPSQFFGDGPQPPEHVNKIPGVAWHYWNAYLLGENKLVVPTIHYVVERELNGPIDFQNMATGSNPAAVIYDLLLKARVPASKIDIPSFNVAAAFWNDKEFGINVSLNSMSDIGTLTKKILNALDAAIAENSAGKIVLKIRDPLSSVVDTLTDDDYLDFKPKRVTYDQIPNDFKATFRDEDQDYTTREIGDQNQAALYLSGNTVTESIDLKIFRNVQQASKRLTEIKKNLSYPALEIEITTHLGFSDLLPGDKIEIQNSRLGIVSATFWVTETSKKENDKNEFSFKCRQVTESLFDDVFEILGGSENVPLDFTLAEFSNVRVYELPYTEQFGFETAFAFLVNREKLFETSFLVQVSETAPSGYVDTAVVSRFAQAGFLAEEYPDTTFEIDETQGILYTPATRDPLFETITQADWLDSQRFALIGNEILYFREVANEGNDIRLSGIIRGRLQTPKETHAISSQIFIFDFADNVLDGISFTTFYSKPVAQFNANQYDPSLITPILTTAVSRAKKPRIPGFVTATRTGSTIDVSIWPNTPEIPGFGVGDPSVVLSPGPAPYSFIGEILVQYDSSEIVLTTTTLTSFTRAGAFTLTIYHKRFNLLSDPYIISVGASDGEYS